MQRASILAGGAIMAAVAIAPSVSDAVLTRKGPYEISNPGLHYYVACGGATCTQVLKVRLYTESIRLFPRSYRVIVNGKPLVATVGGESCEEPYPGCTMEVRASRKIAKIHRKRAVAGFVRFKNPRTGGSVSFKARFKVAPGY